MKSKPHHPFAPHAARTLLAVALLSPSWQAAAQTPSPKEAAFFQDLGFGQIPEGFSTDAIPLIEGLNEARGTWSFEGEAVDGEALAPLAGSLHIEGDPKSGMIPMWTLTWGWPGDKPEHGIIHRVMASPGKSGIEWMLVQTGPVKDPGAQQAQPGILPTMFKGDWNRESRTITWTESDLPSRVRGQEKPEDSSKPKQSFDMVVQADGKISIRNGKHLPQGQLASGKATKRTGAAPKQPVTLIGRHQFKTAAEISEDRIKSSIPPQATDISLIGERGGHFARYKVAEADFMRFLDRLWETGGATSAHKREEMSGEGEPARKEGMNARFKAAGWEPLDKALVYHSPSTGSGAMTTYYYDRETGTAFQDTGYW